MQNMLGIDNVFRKRATSTTTSNDMEVWLENAYLEHIWLDLGDKIAIS